MTGMCKAIAATFLAAAAVMSAWSQQATAADEKELIRLQNAWAEARIKGDVAFMEKLFAKEFTVTGINGGENSRSADIEMFASGDMKPEIVRDEQMKVAVYGDVAMVTGIEHLKGKYKGNPGEFMLRFTNIYVRRDGRWQMIKHHGTEMRKNKVEAKP